MENTLNTIRNKIVSDKVRERQEGIRILQEAFQRNSVILAVDQDGKGGGWLVLFQALFSAFAKEHKACLKAGKDHPVDSFTGNGVALRRLCEVVSALRFLVERGVHRMNTRVVSALLEHLVRHVQYRGHTTAVTLDYAKAIKCLLKWKPHLQHLTDENWVTLTTLSFNIILGDRIHAPLVQETTDSRSQGSRGDTPDTQTVASEVLSQADEDDPMDGSPVTGKRRRVEQSTPRPAEMPGPSRNTDIQMLPVTLDRIEFMSILAVLLGSRTSPLVLKEEEMPNLCAAILDRLVRFLHLFQPDSSLHYDYLRALNAVLSHLALNERTLVISFAREAWPGLLKLWSTKNQNLKEHLVIVLRTLFPYFTADLDESHAVQVKLYEGINTLFRILCREAERRGAEGLSMESLRLESIPLENKKDKSGAFIANTFRYGWHFDANQAMLWAIFELQADCAQQLYKMSESMHATPMNESFGKRQKWINPINTLLESIGIHTPNNVRVFYLQSILFFTDRHWRILHAGLQKQVADSLQTCLGVEDPLTQSWTVLCLGAIAHAQALSLATIDVPLSPSQISSHDYTIPWDYIWQQVMRRTTATAISRAACHAANILLLHSKSLLNSHKVLTELETLSKDLAIQGPSYPCDSACSFLVSCMRVASHDVRLYRLQLEEKVLTWFMDSWRPGGLSKSRMAPYVVDDILALLGSICGISNRAEVLSLQQLPKTPIVDAMVVEQDPHSSLNKSKPAPSQSHLASSNSESSFRELVEPGRRERRISGYFLKSLEELSSNWDSNKDSSAQFPAEKTRTYLDLAVTALCYEGSLMHGGTQINRRVLQAACKLMTLVTPTLEGRRWSHAEQGLILGSLEPLVLGDPPRDLVTPWETLLPPGPGTGIRFEMLQTARSPSREIKSRLEHTARRGLQRAIMQSADVQDAIAVVLKSLRIVLRKALNPATHTRDKDLSTDDFGQTKTSTEVDPVVDDSIAYSETRPSVDVCVTALAVLPAMQSACEPTRDKELVQLVEDCPGFILPLLTPAFLQNVREKTLSIKPTTVTVILETIGSLLGGYHHSHSDLLHYLLLDVLDATMHIWVQPGADAELQDHIIPLLEWQNNLYLKGKMRSWRCRDRFVQFLDHFMHEDSLQKAWPETDIVPTQLMYPMVNDNDIRVRFRTSASIPRCFMLPRLEQRDPLEVYNEIRKHVCKELSEYEGMLTRLLFLGNMMIVSSAVRRGAYWHFLETSLNTPTYNRHMETILEGLAIRFGLRSFSQLFEIYASQIAYSIRQNAYDFLRLPPHLIGYRDRRECAEACFHAFTPTNVLAGGTSEARTHGRNLFERHCHFVSKSTAEGVRECFAEIVGYQVVSWAEDHQGVANFNGDILLQQLRLTTKEIGTEGSNGDDLFLQYLSQYADGIVATVLRTLGDQDFSPNGQIVAALESEGQHGVTRSFLAMSKYRRSQEFPVHEPNLPVFYTSTVIGALTWFTTCIPEVDRSATTYHVLHQLFADLNRSPLINEQLRLYNAIAVWLALHRNHVGDVDVLRTVVNGATTMLMHSDSARAAQSLLEWTFSLLGASNIDTGAHLAETLIRISCTAYDYSIHEDIRAASMGHELMDWIESQSYKLSQHQNLKRQVLKALSTWPRELPDYLKATWDKNSRPDVSQLLGDRRIVSNKFRVVRRLRELTLEGAYDDAQFSKSDFWRLKECIPALEQILDSDVDAFCELLVLQRGHIDGLGNDQSAFESVRTRHMVEFSKENKGRSQRSLGLSSARRAVILSLVSILDEPSTTRVYEAYVTLKSFVSQPSLHGSSDPNQPDIFRQFPRPASSRPPPDITNLLTDDSYLDMSTDFRRWILCLALLLNDLLGAVDPLYYSLASILQVDAGFAEEVTPVLVHCALVVERSGRHASGVSTVADTLSTYFTKVLCSDFASVTCRRVIVDIVLHLRHFSPEDTKDCSAYDKWLSIDYVLLSKNALLCGAFTTALLFIELAAEYASVFSLEAPEIEDIMHDIYTHIDEPDGFYGIRTNNLSQFLIKRFHHEQQWDKAFQFHGAGLEAGSSTTADAEGVLQALHSFGFNNLAIQALHSRSGSNEGPKSSAMAYRLGWRTDTWDLPETTEYRDPGVALYVALRAVDRERDTRISDSVVRTALREQMDHLRNLGDENLTEIRQVSQSLMCLNQVIRWRSDDFQRSLLSKSVSGTHWKLFCQIDPDFEFLDLEAILATRTSLLRFVRRREQGEQIGVTVTPFCQGIQDLETQCLLRLSEAARQGEQAQIALNSVTLAQRLQSRLHFEVSQEYAQVLWLKKEPKYAVQYLRSLLLDMNQKADAPHQNQDVPKATLLTTLGTWTSEACLEKPAHVMTQYFSPAASIMDSQSVPNISVAVYYQFAIFADRQYHAMARSPDAMRLKLYLDRKKLEVEQRKKTRDGYAQGSEGFKIADHSLQRAEKVLQEDRRRYEEHIQARDAFLMQAVAMYSRSLELSDQFDDDSAIRLCSLWFANFSYDAAHFQSKLAIALGRVASRKFVFLAHQLTARLSTTDSSSREPGQDVLQTLVKRMCREHPFHSLYQVFCLGSDRKAQSGSSSDISRRRSSRQIPMSSQADRADAAVAIFDQLRSDSTFRSRLCDVEKLCNASLKFATYELKKLLKGKTPTGPLLIPADQALLGIKDLRVPVMTAHVPIDITARYDNCVWIHKYERKYVTAGGLNLPKIAVCVGSDGRRYKQLFKGEGGDDLRQDAVMEQVFDLVNVVLRRDRETRKRHLHVRGYKVIPLASQAGVLEFVSSTIPLIGWLEEAHHRYHPQEPGRREFHEIEKVRQQGKVAPLRELFGKLWGQVKPVMRHYFTERHKTPMSWFRLRLNYARSVATTSIVGHILGLGDRHTSNILLDNESGEVVHIDLGIAFDQGKLLPVPEKVPFRLTRDMIDGLGVTDTQGVFQRCAEETLRVLRDGSEVILTVLEVFKYDPLHSWTASELKVKRAQSGETVAAPLTGEATRHAIGLDMASGIADEAADRAVTSVSRKLDKTLTVEFTVNELISEATDIDNLADMFHGWQALW
ncbi:unnamed protein product [Somion occarium]|uniref:Serine/threonine-protein kinase Tel1 n=1 Tax=Somion occarium TaxID=3059160 RepID=A0ABP1E3G5_9APHY